MNSSLTIAGPIGRKGRRRRRRRRETTSHRYKKDLTEGKLLANNKQTNKKALPTASVSWLYPVLTPYQNSLQQKTTSSKQEDHVKVSSFSLSVCLSHIHKRKFQDIKPSSQKPKAKYQKPKYIKKPGKAGRAEKRPESQKACSSRFEFELEFK